MTLPNVVRSIRARLAAIILLAMTALVVFLVYQGIDQRNDEEDEAIENLERLAAFAASAERERFDSAERLLVLARQAGSFTEVAANPGSPEEHQECTRTLFVLDQILPGTRFSLWDTSGDIICSSRAAERGEFSAANQLWFETAQQRQGLGTGEFERLHQGGEPSLSLGIPITDPATDDTIAYLSTALQLSDTDAILAAADLPQTGQLTIVDANGTVISSTGSQKTGEELPWFNDVFGGLPSYLATDFGQGDGRTGAAARITDSDDALVAAIVSADTDTLVAPLGETLLRVLVPIALVTLISLIAVWLLAQQWFARPIGALISASNKLAAGELGARAQVPVKVTEFEQLADVFNDMAATRERASQAKDEFLGLVSHELKTPITTTLGNAEILRNRGDRLDPEMRQQALEDIHESALRLATIIDNLLVLARLERGVGLEGEPLALLRMTQSTTEAQLRRTPNRRVLVRGDNSVLGLGGETYVEQVLQNLIGNAIKYSPPDEPVEVLVERDAGMASVRVLDRGPGIEEGEREAIFQPFYRSERTASAAEGIGIGLSVCKRLIEAMDGEIWYAPRPDGGGEFGFTLPLAAEDAEAPGAPEQRDEPVPVGTT